MKKYYLAQIFALVAGTCVAWMAVYDDFARFYGAEGTFFKLQDCIYPNPVLTPCFYGAFGFLGALVFAIIIFKKTDRIQKLLSEKYLSWFLVGGTLFGLGNFTKLYLDYMNGSKIGCSGAPMTSPFVTPCFYGASLFLFSFIISWLILWMEQKGD